MSNIEDLNPPFDPFAEPHDEKLADDSQKKLIHVRIQQRNGRKTLTTVQGIDSEFDPKKILKELKKKFACNGAVVNDEELGVILQFSGDQRGKVAEFLLQEGIRKKDQIKIHGF